MDRLLISAAHKSSGKTTVSIGLCAVLADKLDIQPYKKGPDYIDPMWLGRAAGRDCHNLDFYTMRRDEIIATLQHYSRDCDFSLIEGNKGLYDGLDIEGSNSNAALADLTHTPVVLVINVQGMTRGIAPLILGYQAFDSELNIAGVILNQIRGSRHESKLRAVIEHYTNVPVVGAVYHDAALQITERHLGLIPSNENRAADNKIREIRDLIRQQVNLESILDIAMHVPPLPDTGFELPLTVKNQDVRIAIARDEAFGFYYPDDLLALRAAGAELLEVDTTRDKRLPEVDGLFIGGGFPESRMEELAANTPLRESIKQAIENGLPAYAECGGLMYLSRSLSWKDKKAEMVGILPGDVVMYDTPQGRGYVKLEETEHALWPLSRDQEDSRESPFPGHEFHYSAIENLPENISYAYKVIRGTGIDGKNDGIVYKNLLACYAHLRDTDCNHWAKRFVEFVRSLKQA